MRSPVGFEATLSPGCWETIGAVRQFVAALFRTVLPCQAMADQVALAAHELLENAVKYSATARAPVRCEARGRDGRVRLCVRNRATPQAIATLGEVFALVQAGDPLEAYLAMMERSLTQDATSQLGLARIRYETGARLELVVERHHVQLEAHFDFTDPRMPS